MPGVYTRVPTRSCRDLNPDWQACGCSRARRRQKRSAKACSGPGAPEGTARASRVPVAHPRRRRGGLPPPARASRARTCRTRCRASTKPSAFMPTGALCPCTSSAMADPAAAAAAPLPRSGLPLRSGTRSRKGKVAPLPAEGKPREGTARSVRDRLGRSRVCEAGSPGT